MTRAVDVAPPPRPPPLLGADALRQLCVDGYVGLDLPPPLASALDGLRAAADAFFARPAADKDSYRAGGPRGPPCAPGNTERGYMRLPGEKEYLTLRRSLTHVPDVPGLADLAALVWHDVARLLHRILADMGGYLGLAPTAWDGVVADSLQPGLPAGARPRDDPPTLLRLFRYEPGGGGAEQHRDLGLLTLCVCWGSGLQVRPPQAHAQAAADRHQAAGACQASPHWIDAPRVTVMAGDTLFLLSDGAIPSAVHRVLVDPPDASAAAGAGPPPPSACRRSIVFALRATVAGDIDLAPFGTDATVNALQLYNSVRQQRVNINTPKHTRDKTREHYYRATPGASAAAADVAGSSIAQAATYADPLDDTPGTPVGTA